MLRSGTLQRVFGLASGFAFRGATSHLSTSCSRFSSSSGRKDGKREIQLPGFRKLSRKFPAPPEIEKILDGLRDAADLVEVITASAIAEARRELATMYCPRPEQPPPSQGL